MPIERAANSFIPQTGNDYQRNEGICFRRGKTP
jgi:hypothetical protein